MKRLAAWVAQASHHWLAGFLTRYGLDSTPALVGTFPPVADTKTVLHVGCGPVTMGQVDLPGFHEEAWDEVRLDADPEVSPDIVGTMVDMSAVPDAFADAIFSSHNIEHLHWQDVSRALAEFCRTLKDEGFAVITCPDVQTVAQLVVEDRLLDTAYLSDAGPITPFDMLYGLRSANPQWMSHRSGFTLTTLMAVLREAGFPSCYGIRRPSNFDLWVLASKSKRSPEELSAMAKKFLVAVD